MKDRWGQTPLSESILFKHTKVASILKRHERAKALQNGMIAPNIYFGLVQKIGTVSKHFNLAQKEKFNTENLFLVQSKTILT